MKHAIVHITPPKPDADHTARGAYSALLQKIEITSQSQKNITQLAENVWQIALEKNLPVLAAMFQGCQAQHLQIRVLFLEDAEWVSL